MFLDHSCNALQFSTLQNANEKHHKRRFFYCIYNHRTTKTNQKYPSVNL